MELILVTLLVLIIGVMLGISLFLGHEANKVRTHIEDAWKEIYLRQASEINELRNRLMSKTWEDFHNLQTATPSAIDRAGLVPTLGRLDPDESSGDLRDRLEQAMAEMDLEGGSSEPWTPTVG